MNEAHSPAETLEEILADIKTLRDRIKVKLHLAGMEVKDAYEKLEPRLHTLEREVKAQGEAAREELAARLKEARDALAKLGGHLI